MIGPSPCTLSINGHKIGDGMRWEKLAPIRTLILVLLGFLAIAYGAFLIFIPAGLIVLGIGLVLLGYLTDAPAEARR